MVTNMSKNCLSISKCSESIRNLLSLFIILALVSCVDNPTESVAESDFMGKDIFRGIMFGQGPVADYIPEIRDHYKLDYYIHDESQRETIVQITDRIIRLIVEKDPNYFEEFKYNMESSDHLMINDALNVAWNKILEIIQKDEYFNTYLGDIKNLTNPSNQICIVLFWGVYNYLVVAHSAAIAVQGAVAITYAVTIGVYLYVEKYTANYEAAADINIEDLMVYAKKGENNAKFLREKIVNSISITLGQ